ncbi:UvrD-helicase domain-containing protein [Candidatus Neomarinimicrobiota bacterium]
MFELSPKKKELLETEGNILATGGPGSGKTTIALLKAEWEVGEQNLKQGQRILFLSFARATIARIIEEANKHLSKDERTAVEINTYHGFAWNIIRSHGYLLHAEHPLHLLTPHEAAARLSEIPLNDHVAAKWRIFEEEGLLDFDLFAPVSAEILERSNALARIVNDTYPIVILDEFQDTNSDEWRMIQLLGRSSRLIALADTDQRIYEFRGADPKRVDNFVAEYTPSHFDFSDENHRSNGTDIIEFGNDLLTKANKSKAYSNVEIVRYQVRRGIHIHLTLKSLVLRSIGRLRAGSDSNWSLAVLVPTNRLMLIVSDYLGNKQDFGSGRSLPQIGHDVALDPEGPTLAAILISGILETAEPVDAITAGLMNDLCIHLRGRKGSKGPSQKEIALVNALEGYLENGIIRGKIREQIVDDSIHIAIARQALILSGDPSEDWLSVRHLLEDSTTDVFRQIANDAKYLRLLRKGSVLRSSLSDLWRRNDNYIGARSSVSNALLQEHFSASVRDLRGIYVMTLHKSKGKEFDEVIIYEGPHQDRIWHEHSPQQSRLALRVAITRAKQRTTILTPSNNICELL